MSGAAVWRFLAHHPLPRWALVLAWTTLVCLLMLLPGEDSVAEDTSGFFGGTDLTDAAGHVLLFGALTVLWYAALVCHVGPPVAFGRAALVGAALGLLLETGQSLVPERGMSLLDFSANALGVLGAALALRTPLGRRLLVPH
ncbi:MAG: hypothetical protein Kow00106_14050 [Anaerolineae bacterium]